MVSPYRDHVEIEEPMDITKLADRIRETYQKRLEGRESVRVVLEVSSRWQSGYGRGEDLVKGRGVTYYSARLMFKNIFIASEISKTSFEEALADLAENLDIIWAL